MATYVAIRWFRLVLISLLNHVVSHSLPTSYEVGLNIHEVEYRKQHRMMNKQAHQGSLSDLSENTQFV